MYPGPRVFLDSFPHEMRQPREPRIFLDFFPYEMRQPASRLVSAASRLLAALSCEENSRKTFGARVS